MIVSGLKHLPSAPKVLPRLKRLLTDGNSSLQDIAALLRLDPGIAARVLQVSNSAYFSAGVHCTTVEDAVQRVGYDQVYELVSYAVASQVLIRPLEVYGIEAEELWTMSVAGAIAAEVLASRIGQARDTAYTFGLLHCVGMVAINEWSLRHSPGLKLAMAQFPREATEAERAVFGFIQAEAGGALLEHWQLPTEIVTPVRWQYAPQATATHRHSALILHLAKWVRDKVCDRGPPPSDRARLDALRLTPAMLEDVTDLVTGRLREIDTLLQLPELPADLHRCAVR